jgi:hypothetical protein
MAVYWGKAEAWIVAGAPTLEEGLEAARQFTNKPAALDVALAAIAACLPGGVRVLARCGRVADPDGLRT